MEQQAGLVQVLPGQQGVPGDPQATHRLLLQIVFALWQTPAVPLAAAQQALPKSPHFEQTLLRHLVSAAVQVSVPPLEQQAWPGPPHAPHEPFEQMPSPRPTQTAPWAMHMFETQQPPPRHELPAQQL